MRCIILRETWKKIVWQGQMAFNGYFYKSCQEIIKEYFHRVICKFFVGFELPKSWTITLLVPNPKVDAPTSFSQFRPICLCNFANNVISKILASRLTSILPSIISREQSGFVKGRVIQDNILLAQEMIHEIKRKVRGSNVANKLDMKKTYD